MLRTLAAVALLLLCAPACTQPVQPDVSAAAAFHVRLDREWAYWMEQYPEVATAVGYPGQDRRWTDYSPEAIEARTAHLNDSLEGLDSIDPARLDDEDRLSYDLYRQLLESATSGLAFHNDGLPIRGVIPHNLRMPVNQLEGVQQEVPRTLALMPTSSLEAYENLVARLEGVARLVDQTLALLQVGLDEGMTPPRVTLRDVPAQIEGLIADEPLTSPLLEPLTRWPASIPEADRTRLTARASAAYTDGIAPAFRRLHTFLTDTYLPRCRETIAASALPSGDALYVYNVTWHTTTELTPAEIHDIGLAEVERIRAEMDAEIAKTGFGGTFEEFVEVLRTDPRFYYTTAEDLLRGYRDIAKRADPELAHLFGRLPGTPYGVIAVPDAIAPSQTTAYYQPGSLGAGRAGYMQANTYLLDARPMWEMEALTLHESVPGHHLQIAIAQELEGLPEFRRHSSYTAFVEGWGLYAELLGEEMGFYTDPYSKFGQLTYQMWRAVRLVVDTGMHVMGWTRDEAIDYFKANAPKTEQDIIVEIDRYIVWPGQGLGYKIGELKLRELRRDAQQQLGSRFDVRGFHDVVLGEGALPLDVLESRVSAWAGSR